VHSNTRPFTIIKPPMELFKASAIRTIEDEFFMPFLRTERCQVATMKLLPDQVSGEYGNEHPEADQIVVVLEGGGHAIVSDDTVELEEGDLLLIRAGEKHQLRADGAGSLVTLNFYSPPVYPDQPS
jgi:quercetin dioxygenase-like cupin family protein